MLKHSTNILQARKGSKRASLRSTRSIEQAQYGAILGHGMNWTESTSTTQFGDEQSNFGAEDSTMQFGGEQSNLGAEDFGTTPVGTDFNAFAPNQMSDSPPDVDSHHSISQQPYYSISTDDNDEASSIHYMQPGTQTDDNDEASSIYYMQPETQQSSNIQPETQQSSNIQSTQQYERPLLPDVAELMPALEIPIARAYRGKSASVRPQAPPIASHLSSVLLQPVP